MISVEGPAANNQLTFGLERGAMAQTLFDLQSMGETAEIVDFSGSTCLIERLKEMGLRQGLHIIYAGQAPFRGPKMFRVGTTVIALREEEAQCAIIKK